MSNIANQLIAVVATLLGFVAHDILSERNVAPSVIANAALSAPHDPTTTRSIDLEGSPRDWLAVSMRAERGALRAPAARMPPGTLAAARPDPYDDETELAGIRVNDARSIAPAVSADAAFLR